MQITIIGSGYVGLVAGTCLAELGHTVVIVDKDRKRVDELRAGAVPIHEEHLPELLARHGGKSLTFTYDIGPAVRSSKIVIIAVGTPANADGDADLSQIESVAREISGNINDYKVVVEKSTVPVCTSRWIRKVMLLNGAPSDKFDVVSNPEFLREGTAVADFLYPDRIVVGADEERCSEIVCGLYEHLVDGTYEASNSAIRRPLGSVPCTRIIQTSIHSAELIKHACNAYLAMKISFANAISAICECVGADIGEVCEGIGSDRRIGPQFLHAGIGYGGSCLPKDLSSFSSVVRDFGYHFHLLDEVARINSEQRQRFLRKVRTALWSVKGKRLAVLGLAFKGGTDDIRESPAISTIEELVKQGSTVVAWDPAAMRRAAEVLPKENVAFANTPYEAAKGADALLILTDWKEFETLDLKRLRRVLRYPILVDGRNLFNPVAVAEAGLHYYSFGRDAVVPCSASSVEAADLRAAA